MQKFGIPESPFHTRVAWLLSDLCAFHRLFHWDRALELAVHHKTHVDTVLMMRERYNQAMGRTEETNPRFLQFGSVV